MFCCYEYIGEERFEVGEEVSTVDMGSGKSLPDWGNGNCKGVGMEAYLACTDGVPLCVFAALPGLSLVVASRGYSSFRCCLLIVAASFFAGSRLMGFSICSTQTQQLCLLGSREGAQ